MAPPAVRVDVPLAQRADGLLTAVTVGKLFTVTETVFVFTQPLPSVPVTVYWVVTVSDGVIVAVIALVLQV